MARPEAQDLFSKHRVGKVYFVAENRRGGLRFGPTGRSRIAVGMLEYHLYTAPIPLKQNLSWARNLSDLRAILLEQVAKLDELAADEWEVVPSGESYRLLDTRHPADDLEVGELL